VRARKTNCPRHWAQVVRFVKWWVREQKMSAPDDSFRFKSFMVELVSAISTRSRHRRVRRLPGRSGRVFFDYVVRTELAERVAFADYYDLNELSSERQCEIEVFDPVNTTNNIAWAYEAGRPSTHRRCRIQCAGCNH